MNYIFLFVYKRRVCTLKICHPTYNYIKHSRAISIVSENKNNYFILCVVLIAYYNEYNAYYWDLCQ